MTLLPFTSTCSGNVYGFDPYEIGNPSCLQHGMVPSKKYQGLCSDPQISSYTAPQSPPLPTYTSNTNAGTNSQKTLPAYPSNLIPFNMFLKNTAHSLLSAQKKQTPSQSTNSQYKVCITQVCFILCMVHVCWLIAIDLNSISGTITAGLRQRKLYSQDLNEILCLEQCVSWGSIAAQIDQISKNYRLQLAIWPISPSPNCPTQL